MKAQDLRIGNFLYPIHLDGDCEVIEIRREGISVRPIGNEKKSAFIHWEVIHRLEPIPLTEKWYLKFEFNRVGDCIRKPLNEFIELCYIIPLKELRLQTVNSGFTINLSHVKYVHNLQNLWKEHIGKELK